ncbi:MAG: glutathione S-transferase family protein [Polyangiaceae bacterium]|nr:glutathione S-transferase family protein [Polyangiaceae bacterium]
MKDAFATNRASLVLCEFRLTTIPRVESYSPFCLKARRALHACGLSYTSRFGLPYHFRSLNPAAQIPILLVDGRPVCDSTRILETLDELAPGVLLPSDARGRAEAWLWEDWADRSLATFVIAARWVDDRNWPIARDAFFKDTPWFVRTMVAPKIRRTMIRSLERELRAGESLFWDDFHRLLDHLERLAPKAGFWGDAEKLSLADIAIFAPLHSLRTPLTKPQAQQIAMRPSLTGWLDRVDTATDASAIGSMRGEST